MIHIKRFIDRVSVMENKNGKDLVMPMFDARGLRDELAKLLADLHHNFNEREYEEPVITVEMKGGSFK